MDVRSIADDVGIPAPLVPLGHRQHFLCRLSLGHEVQCLAGQVPAVGYTALVGIVLLTADAAGPDAAHAQLMADVIHQFHQCPVRLHGVAVAVGCVVFAAAAPELFSRPVPDAVPPVPRDRDIYVLTGIDVFPHRRIRLRPPNAVIGDAKDVLCLFRGSGGDTAPETVDVLRGKGAHVAQQALLLLNCHSASVSPCGSSRLIPSENSSSCRCLSDPRTTAVHGTFVRPGSSFPAQTVRSPGSGSIPVRSAP